MSLRAHLNLHAFGAPNLLARGQDGGIVLEGPLDCLAQGKAGR